MIADERKYLFHIKNYGSKIHVGLNQKFTSKNSRSKNSRAGLWVFPVGVCSPLGRARGRVHCFNACKGKHNERQQQHVKRLQIKIFNNIMILKTNEKSKQFLLIYIRYRKNLQKKSKKIWYSRKFDLPL